MVNFRRSHIIFFLFALSLNLLLPHPAMADSTSAPDSPPVYELAVHFQPDNNRLNATAHITLKAGKELNLDFHGLSVSSIMLNRDNRSAMALEIPANKTLHLPPAKTGQDIFISYTKTIHHSSTNMISDRGIMLSEGWHPGVDQPMLFRLSCTVPDGFIAISESDHFTTRATDNRFSFSFSRPLFAIHLAAGPYVSEKLKVREGLFVHSLFFHEDRQLAEDYLKKAAGFIKRYEEEIGPFPYNHYVIVENRLPVGYGMNTFTLLGQMVIRLPFIKETSLGHEVLHSWFGNSIEVDYTEGNWCEGLTTYLADQAYQRDRGKGSASRKATLINDLSYVQKGSEISLEEFTSASHTQPMAKAIRAVGYGRVAALFHELENKLGEAIFQRGLQHFYQTFRGKQAGWTDIRTSFEAVSSQDLNDFFQQRLQTKELIHLAVNDPSLALVDHGYALTFRVTQKSKKPFSLQLPILVRTVNGNQQFTKAITATTTTITLDLDENPLEVILDPDYDLMRRLEEQEIPPVLSRFLGAEKKLVILESESVREKFAPLLDRLKKTGLEITTSDQVKNRDLGNRSLLFLGLNGATCRSLFADVQQQPSGFTLSVRNNPLHTDHVAILVSAGSRDEVKAAAHKLSHYGKYSFLHFVHGSIKDKRIEPSQSGIRMILDPLPSGGPTTGLSDFGRIMDQLTKKQVVYIGESHTSLADHILQFRIIEALYKLHPNLAIGMEMFPHSSQAALDEYTLGDGSMDEKVFLKKSHYFKVWRYDYRLFRSTLGFAVRHKIPVIGLNLEREIVSNIFQSGSTDGLSEEQKKSLPVDRDLDMTGYRERLQAIYQMHMRGPHSGSFSGFIQSQALWDETMAETISNYLGDHPETLMVVLAGSQHTRKDSGIPPRLARRMVAQQASVINLFSNLTTDLADQTDYYFLAAEGRLSKTAKIGIVLEEKKDGEKSLLQISKISPHGNAGKDGLEENDILLTIDGLPIETMEDVRIAMVDATPGQQATIRVKRGESGQEKELEYQVTLYQPRGQKPHP